MVLKRDNYDGTVHSEVKWTDEVIKVRLSELERTRLNECQVILEQPKSSTCLKELAWIGANVVQDKKMSYILQVIFENKRKNKQLGVIEYDT